MYGELDAIACRGWSDPLVLDLDGDGLELIAQSVVAPLFDIDGDRFAERTGWVRPDDGFLVRDENANGVIDNVREMFGGRSSGFAELATHDGNADGKIDAADAVFASLRVWRDLDGDGVTDAGELQSLAELGIASIDLAATAQAGVTNAGNRITATATFTRSDGTTGQVADIAFKVDNHRTEFTGDRSISAAAAALPEVKGRGTLADLRVAMTLDPTLVGVVQAALPGLTQLDLAALRAAATPILAGWARALQLPDAQGQLAVVDPAQRPDIPILLSSEGAGPPQVSDFAYQVTDAQGSYWRLASGDDVLDEAGLVIARPTQAQVLANQSEDGAWTVFAGEQLGFLERYIGETLPLDAIPVDPQQAQAQLGGVIEALWHTLNVVTVRLAAQGPLAPYFSGVAYDVAKDTFHATTDRQLVPMYEAIFAAAPQDAAAARTWLAQWQPILEYVLGDFDRGRDGLLVTYSYVFANVVGAFESTGLPLAIAEAASLLGVPAELIVTGPGELVGTSEADIFYMSAGDQIARGGFGRDTYVFGRGFGHDVVDDTETAGLSASSDLIRFADIKSTDVTAYGEGIDLVLRVNGTDDQVVIKNQFLGRKPGLFGGDANPDTGVDEIAFVDGVVWDKFDIAYAVSHPQATNDTLEGTPDIDYLDAGAGDDSVTGGDDGDTYHFDRGYGHDSIRESGTNILLEAPDILELGTGLAVEDVAFKRTGNSDDLEIEVVGTDDRVTVLGQFAATYTGVFGTQWYDRIEVFTFADGSYYTADEVMEKILAEAKTEGDDTIYGFAREDTLDGGAGDDFLSGGNEADTYRFDRGYGNDTVRDNQTNILSGPFDTVAFGLGLDWTNIAFERDGASNDLRMVLDDGSTLTLAGQFAPTYTGFGIWWIDRIEYFAFGDPAGTVWTVDDVMDLLIAQAQTAGNDAVYGFAREDALDGGLGDDTLSGGEEGDSYVFKRGYDHDRVQDASFGFTTSANIDEIAFGPDIALADLVLQRSGNDLVITIAGTDDRLTIGAQYVVDTLGHGNYMIEQFRFADGTVLSAAAIEAERVKGTAGNDSIVGWQYADTLDGGAGDDTLEGDSGGDTYHFDVGYGHDTVRDVSYGLFGQADRVVFGPGISVGALRFAHDGDDLVISLPGQAGQADTLRIVGQYLTDALGNSVNLVEEFWFADGTVLTAAGAQAASVVGTPGDDLLVGWDYADTLDGGAGDDWLQGNAGDDTYKFDVGYGHDTIVDSSYGSLISNFDTVQLGAGIARENVRFSRDGDDLILSLIDQAGGADTLRIVGQSVTDTLGNAIYFIEQFAFADGTVMTAAQAQAAAVQGTPGNDLLLGWNYADTLDGGAGDDTLQGAAGDDVYRFDVGYGHDTIYDQAYGFLGDFDRIVFGPGITTGNIRLWQSTDGYHLTVGVGGTADRLDVTGTLGSGFNPNRIEQVEFSDGTIWSTVDILARLTTGGPGNDSLSGSSRDETFDGGAGDDTIDGWGGHDLIYGGDGNDLLMDSGGGYDTLYGGDGDDTLIGGVGADVIDGGAGIDTWSVDDTASATSVNLATGTSGGGDTITGVENIRGSAYDDLLIGDGNANKIEGRGGNDAIDGGAGADSLVGGAGNDLYTVDDAGDVVTELAAEGADTIQTTLAAYVLSEHLEHLTFLGAADASGTGNASNNTLRGNAGNDTLDGGGGIDTLIGGTGNDTYVVDSSGDVVNESPNQGIDTVRASASYVLGLYIENLELIGTDAINGTGNVHNNTLVGNAAANVLDGWSGADTYYGGAGDDTYIIDAGDVVVENADEGIDLVQSYVTTTLTANVENLTLLGGQVLNGTGNALANVIVGNSGHNVLDGGAGADTLAGGVGNDTYIVDDAGDVVTELEGQGADTVLATAASWVLSEHVEDLTFLGTGDSSGTGNALNNTIRGNVGSDTLDGGSGVDTLIGGAGNDTYIVDVAGDVVAENANEGIDTVRSGISITLAANVENLVLTGSIAINGTGNALGNTLHGNAAANVLDGWTGADTYYGGAGDDTYIIDAGDVVIENDGEGVDHVQSYVTTTLTANVENLTLVGTAGISGTGNALDNSIVGNNASNTLSGGDGNDYIYGGDGNDLLHGGAGNDTLDGYWGGGGDTMHGGAGDDLYVVDYFRDSVNEVAGEGTDRVDAWISYTLTANVESLALQGTANLNGTGNAQDNVIIGNAGANVLDGSVGADTVVGGAGDDTYVIENAGDVPTENSGEGTDLVQSFIAWTLGANIENLTLLGTGAIGGTGNALDNAIIGNNAANTLSGEDGNDYIYGGDGNDLLYGGAGNDTLDGYWGGGGDTMYGGVGDDLYVVDYAPDRVNELAGEGIDRVDAWISYTLTVNVENLFLQGTGNLNGTGNTLDNAIYGNAGANVLDGGLGADTLSGGLGNDTYVFDAADVIVEQAGGGIDLLQSSVTVTLVANVENLTLTGSNVINGTGNELANTITGNSAANVLSGGAGADFISGASGEDTLYGGDGDDLFDGGVGADLIDGGDGSDTVTAYNWIGGATINLAAGTINDGDVLISIENIEGSNHGDHLTGNGGANRLLGKNGNDTILGNGGDDFLEGGSGVDSLVGGDGNDTFDGGVGADVIDGGDGFDTVTAYNWGGGATINLATGTINDGDTLTSVEAIYGSAYNDLFTGSAAANRLEGQNGNDTLAGGDGDDTIDGGAGADSIDGGAGNDTLTAEFSNVASTINLATGTGSGGDAIAGIENLRGSALNDSLSGDGNANRIEGLAGDDTLDGGAGDDTLAGGAGSDTLTGGLGNDVYQLGRGDGADRIDNGASDLATTTDELQFGDAIAEDQLWFSQSGNDLVVQVIGTGDTATIGNWYGGSQARLDDFRTVGNRILTEANVQQLVDAMAQFSPPAAGQTTLPPELASQLQPVIAAAWQNAA